MLTPNANRPPQEIVYIPALALLGGIFLLQRRRRDRQQAAGKPAEARKEGIPSVQGHPAHRRSGQS